MKWMNSSGTIEIAAKHIQEGRLVAFPTETVYGLGANALDPFAVARIFELKERPSFDPLIVHIADLGELETLALNPDERVYRLAERFWPGPLTLVLPKREIVPDLVTAGLPTVGIRIPAHDIALELIRASKCPIAAPSANPFGRISPTTADHVQKRLPGVDYVIDGGKTTVGIESTILQLTERGFRILRHGGITKEEIESILPWDPAGDGTAFAAPGMLPSHYRPGKKMWIAHDATLPYIDKGKAGLLSFSGRMDAGYKRVIRVSETHDAKEYAVHLFDAMHTLEDDNAIELIVAEPVPETGIGRAIMDRLRKATFHWQKDEDHT